MGNSARLFSAPGVDGLRTVPQIAALAGCSTVNVYVRIREGRPVAGHVWSVATDAPNGRARKLMESDDFPGRTFTQDEVRAMGNLKPSVPLQPYVRKGSRVGGHVWRFVGAAVTRSPGEDNVAPPAATCAWGKAAPAPVAPAPPPEPRGHVWAAESELMPINGARIPAAADGPAGVKL